MPKLKTDPVTPETLTEYLDKKSDFAFELRVLNQVARCHYDTAHAGTYTDPVTGKARQFDIQATRGEGRICARFAIECKNLAEFMPLLVSTVPRSEEEAYYQLLRNKNGGTGEDPVYSSQPMRGSRATYPDGESVGKSLDRVGVDKSGEVVGENTEVYDRWSQAIASAQDLVNKTIAESDLRGETYFLILPVLVVPDGTLWEAQFDRIGRRVREPQAVDRLSYFVDAKQEVPYKFPFTFRFSHLEIVTVTGLITLLSEPFRRGISRWFPIRE